MGLFSWFSETIKIARMSQAAVVVQNVLEHNLVNTDFGVPHSVMANFLTASGTARAPFLLEKHVDKFVVAAVALHFGLSLCIRLHSMQAEDKLHILGFLAKYGIAENMLSFSNARALNLGLALLVKEALGKPLSSVNLGILDQVQRGWLVTQHTPGPDGRTLADDLEQAKAMFSFCDT